MTDVTRRTVIGVGAAGLAVGATGVTLPSAVAGAPAVAQATDPSYTEAASLYRRPRFASRTGRYFALVGGGMRVTVRLTQVEDLAGEAAGSPTNFRLTFTTTAAGPRQGTYSLRRKNFVTTSLFVVPDDASRRSYTAIINGPR